MGGGAGTRMENKGKGLLSYVASVGTNEAKGGGGGWGCRGKLTQAHGCEGGAHQKCL